MQELGFEPSHIRVKPFQLTYLQPYTQIRDFPALDQTSYLSVHLRFGTIGIRELVYRVQSVSETFLSELIWREFFMQILFHFPQVVHRNFYTKFDAVQWRNDEKEFQKWKDENPDLCCFATTVGVWSYTTYMQPTYSPYGTSNARKFHKRIKNPCI